jgi:hypothetical protein
MIHGSEGLGSDGGTRSVACKMAPAAVKPFWFAQFQLTGLLGTQLEHSPHRHTDIGETK